MQIKKRRLLYRVLRYLILVISSALLLTVLFFLSVYAGIFGPLPDKADLAAMRNRRSFAGFLL